MGKICCHFQSCFSLPSLPPSFPLPPSLLLMITNSMNVLQFTPIRWETEDNQWSTGYGPGSYDHVFSRSYNNIPLQITFRSKLTDSKTERERERERVREREWVSYRLSINVKYLKAASFCSNCTRSKVFPWLGCITLKQDAHIPRPAFGEPNMFSGRSSARKASAAFAASAFSSFPALNTISSAICFLRCIFVASVKALWSVSIRMRLDVGGWISSFLGVYWSGVDTWLNMTPSFSNAKILVNKKYGIQNKFRS